MMAGEFAIRPMREEDAGRVTELCGQLGYPSSVDDIRKRYGSISGDRNHEFSVVDEAWRGQRVGRYLMEFAETWAKSKGRSSIWFKSNIIRDRAHAFYERLGYRTVKTQHVFRKELKLSP
jgi:GNAT superfamily N-acetyltransferase